MNSIYKGVLCFMRRFSKDDEKNALVAGFLCGLSIIIDDKERRILIALIFLTRSLVIIIIICKFSFRIHF